MSSSAVAVIGLAGRFPGARTVSEFWRNLSQGVESIVRYSDEALLAEGVSPALLRHPRYVKAGAPLRDMELFDAEFFGLSPKDAAIMDPQHRQFLECCWEALEDAGRPPDRFPGAIGVWAGCGMNSYLMFNLLSNPDLIESVGLFLVRHTGNDKDFLATRASYCFDLRGPSVSVQTACSTSLVAIHLACQSLLNGEVDMALAGGVTIALPHRHGYLYEEGEILSPDGHCRAFDHRAKGTVFGSGVGTCVLRRLEDALGDGDPIYAVVIGSAINNDGAGKVGYLAPSVDGQAASIAEALAIAGAEARTIQYVETHGTATPVGDPIEIAALTQAFRVSTQDKQFCAIGSVKTNIGHLDTAAGVASFAKAALALHHRQLPPSLHFEAPNPDIDFGASPFFVNTELRPWPTQGGPRRAGVSSLGVGGTNAHVVLEEAPDREATGPSRPLQLLSLSARNAPALDEGSRRLAAWLRENPAAPIADVAWTLHTGRRVFSERRTLVCRDAAEAAARLEGVDPARVATRSAPRVPASVAFMFPGGGAQYPRMGLDLHANEPLFREHLDRGLALLREREGIELRPLLFPEGRDLDAAARTLERPSLQLPALFLIEYALAQLWMGFGVRPTAMIGHSMGENTAACVAGVMSFEDCLGLVALRGRLFERVPKGGMLSVPLDAGELRPLLGDELDLAVENGPGLCVASGPVAALDALERTLAAREIEVRRVKIEIAAHSAMLEPILAEFGGYLRRIALRAPEIPFASNLTGTWVTEEEATDPDYWVRHLRSTVRFAAGVATLLEDPGRVLLEVGPGRTLASLARMNPRFRPRTPVAASLRHPDEQVSDHAFLLETLGGLWAEGVEVDWSGFYAGQRRRRLSLPGYAFQHQRYWIEPGQLVGRGAEAEPQIEKLLRLEDWFYRPIWRRVPIPVAEESRSGEAPTRGPDRQRWLVFLDGCGLGARIAARLRESGDRVATVREGDAFYRMPDGDYVLAPEEGRAGYDALLADLAETDGLPHRIVHAWTLTGDRSARPGSSFYHHVQERGFYSLLFLAQALGEHEVERLHLTVLSNESQAVEGERLAHPEKATLLGPCRVIPQEFPGVTCTHVDVELPSGSRARRRRGEDPIELLADAVLAEVRGPADDAVVAYRRGERWRQDFERHVPDALPAGATRMREGGTYLVTGGLGGIGRVVADHLARHWKARLVLVGRSPLPPREEFASWLATHSPADRNSRKIRGLQALEAAGAQVEVACADVADLTAMRDVVARARERFGPIHGVFHAAGILDDELIQSKTQPAIDELFAPKIQGTLVLDQLFSDVDLDFLVLFSSTSSALGAAGQVDYVAANAFLNAFAHSRRSAGGRPYVVALNWGIWNEVGMAAESVAAADTAEEGGEPEATRHPLLDGRVAGRGGETVFLSQLEPRTHWVLDQHRTGAGQALLPGTAYLELARGAFAEVTGAAACEIRDLIFLAPLAVDDGRSRILRVSLTPEAAGWDLRVESRAGEVALGSFDVHAEGRVAHLAAATAEPLDLAALRARCGRSSEVDPQGLRSGQERHLRFGSRWRCLREVHWGEGEALARVELPAEHAREALDFLLHPALLDLATGYAMELIPGYAADALYVPLSYRRVRVHAPLPQRVWSHVRGSPDNRAGREVASFDVTICDEQGSVLLELEDFQIKKVESEVAFGRTARAAAPEDPAHALSPAQRVFRRTLAAGILPEEGMRALERVLASEGGPQPIVTSVDLDLLIRQVRSTSPRREASGARFSRPALATGYVAPRDEVEEAVVGLYQELLGVDRVGVQDDFFALGGHSLIAVRLFGQIKRRFQVEYPISVLFDAPTVEKIAALIRTERGGEEGASRAIRRSDFRFLVPMHSSAVSRERPFFLVAGMFGNVLNLRHLAGLLGRERPFYAIQARGLHGDERPHDDFCEMARDYLDEVRRVQPVGPYVLGGFSGGGISAYEMAQQLVGAGEEVAALVFLDTPLPRPQDRLSLRDKLVVHAQRLARKGPRYPLDWLRNRIAWERDKRRRDALPESQPYEFRSKEIEAAFHAALARYEIRPYPGRVTLYRPVPDLSKCHVLGPGRMVNQDRNFLYPDNGWTPWVGGLDVHEVPGDHDGMVLEPNVRVLAAKLREALASAEAG